MFRELLAASLSRLCTESVTLPQQSLEAVETSCFDRMSRQNTNSDSLHCPLYSFSCHSSTSARRALHMTTATSARIDEEVEKHLVPVADIRVQKNSLLPDISPSTRNSHKVLIHGVCDYRESIDNRDVCVPDWVNFSYVCRHWRDGTDPEGICYWWP